MKDFKDFRRDTRIAITRYLIINIYEADEVDNSRITINKTTYIAFYRDLRLLKLLRLRLSISSRLINFLILIFYFNRG